MGFKSRNDMKKLILPLLLLCAVLCSTPMEAQSYRRSRASNRSFGLERRVPLKNIYLGVKAGTNALGMRYTQQVVKRDTLIYNPSALWKGDLINCLSGGITVERTLPHFSYGVEGMIMGLDARSTDTVKPVFERDSAWLVDIRIPLRLKFLEDYACSPYVMVAPSFGTYLSVIDSVATDGNVISYAINGQSEWNGMIINWGTNNTRSFHFGLLAGIGMDVKIPIGNYEAKLRVETTYQLGLSNLFPKKFSNKDLKVSRTLRGLEATIGISFPLFGNPHYSWMM